MAHPGKKLLFMGANLHQIKEWNFEQGLDWELLKQPEHGKMQRFFRDLNHFYLENAPFWEIDFTWDGFSWISNDDYSQSIISFRRMDKEGNELIAVCNFQPLTRTNYRIGVPRPGIYAEVFSTENIQYGGSGLTNGKSIQADAEPMHGFEQSLELTIPGLSVFYLKRVADAPARKIEKKSGF